MCASLLIYKISPNLHWFRRMNPLHWTFVHFPFQRRTIFRLIMSKIFSDIHSNIWKDWPFSSRRMQRVNPVSITPMTNDGRIYFDHSRHWFIFIVRSNYRFSPNRSSKVVRNNSKTIHSFLSETGNSYCRHIPMPTIRLPVCTPIPIRNNALISRKSSVY